MRQDGRLARAYFLHECKYFDQHLPTVKNETIVQNLAYKSFLQTSIPPLFLYFMKKGVLRLFVQNFLSHSTKKFRWGTLWCIKKFRVSKNFRHQIGGRDITFLRGIFFVTQYQKISLANTSVFQKNSCIAKFHAEEEISLNFVEKFLSHSADKIRRGTLLRFERILVSILFKQKRGQASRFCRNFFSHMTKKLCQGTILCFRNFLVGKKYSWIRGSGYHDFRSNFYVSQCRKISWASLQCFRKFGVSQKFYA